MNRTDYDRVTEVSRELGVARWGRTWSVLDLTDPPRASQIGVPHPSKAVAIAAALRYIERGDYR